MSGPLVSVVIPTYNRADLLAVALDSVLAQTYTEFEVAVMDDGSTDHTRDLVCGYTDPRVRYHARAHTGLPAPGRNAGVRETRGALVAFLDCDDAWAPGKLARQVAALAAQPAAGFACTNAEVIDERGAPLGVFHRADEIALHGDPLVRLLRGNFVINSSVLARRAVLERAGLFSEDARLRAVEDYDLWLRCAALAPFVYLAEPLTQYRRSSGSISTVQSRRHYADAMRFIHERVAARLADRADAQLRAGLERNLMLAQRAEYKARLGEGHALGALAPWMHVGLLKLKAGAARLLGGAPDKGTPGPA